MPARGSDSIQRQVSTPEGHGTISVFLASKTDQIVLIPPPRRDGPPEAIQDEGVEYYGYGVWPNQESLEKASFSLMATAEMAVAHFVSQI